MTDIEFIKAAKKACIKDIRSRRDDVCAFTAEMTWYSYMLRNYKALFWVHDTQYTYSTYYEVTYVAAEHRLMIDGYDIVSERANGYEVR